MSETISILGPEVRQAALEREIQDWVKKGYTVTTRSEFSAQLVKHKKFSFLWAIFWLIIGVVIGLIVYVFWYWSRKDKAVYISVDQSGKVSVTG